MKQVLEETVEDATSGRLRYMLNHINARVTTCLGHVIFHVCSLVATCCVGEGFARMMVADRNAVSYLTVAAVLTGIAYAGNRMIVRGIAKETSLPFIPTVHEQIAALPAAEILVRGSEQPTASADELLRAAHDGIKTPAEQLLRAQVVRYEEEQKTENLEVQRARQ